VTRRLVPAALIAAILGSVLEARAQAPADSAASDTLRRIVPIPGVEVGTTRAGERAPIARSVLGRDEILERNWGQDTPMALASLPGAYAYSDAGNAIGYSYLFIRGFPQRRISVLVNGVPLNDPESHEVYWIDHPDLLASTAEVEMQRGVGSALYGAASVGGSVHLETSPFAEVPRTSATLAYGSHATRRLMLLRFGPVVLRVLGAQAQRAALVASESLRRTRGDPSRVSRRAARDARRRPHGES
jgi:iron complex outermembrane receptor protein